MAGSVDLFLNISNGLDENLKKSEKSMSGMNDIASKVNKNMTDMNKSSNMLNDNYDDIVESSEKAAKSGDRLAGALDKARGFASKMVGSFGMLFGSFQIIDVVSDTIELNQAMSDLSYRMGEAGTSARDLENATTGVMAATGASAEVSQRWITGLREMRVATEDLQELATVGQRFSVITGASDENTKNLIGSLNTMGGMGKKAIKGILTGMVGVQRAFGMSVADMDRLTDSITSSSKSLRNMGKSAAEVATFSKGISKLAGAFASVGLSAETATKFVNDLLDPGQIEDNAFLYAKLGISMQDAMEGNIDPGKLVGGFKDLGAELKGMSNFAANELAKSLGMPLQELRAMSEMDEGAIAKALGQTLEVSEDLKKEQDEQAELQRKFAEASEKTKSVFMALALKAMPLLNKGMDFVMKVMDSIVPKAKAFIDNFKGKDLKKMGVLFGLAILGAIFLLTRFRKKFASVNTEVGKGLSKALSAGMDEAMDMGAEKAATKFEKRMKAGTSAYMEDLQQRILEGTDYAATQAASNFYKTMGGTKLTKGAAALANHAGEYLDKISAGAKPVSMIDKFLEKSNSKMQEKIKLEEENYFQVKGAIDLKEKAAKSEVDSIQNRINKIEETRNKEGKLAPARQAELLKLEKLFDKQEGKRLKAENELEALKDQNTKRKVSLLKNVSEVERKIMSDNLESEISRGEELRKNIKIDQDNNQLSLDTLGNAKKALDLEIINSDIAIKNGKLKGKDLIEANKLRNELVAQQKETNELLVIEEDRKASLANHDKAALDSMKQLNKELEEVTAAGDLTGVDTGIWYKSIGEKIKGTFGQAKNSLVGGLKSGLHTVSDSLKTSLKAGKAIINPKNWKKAISAAGDGSFFKGLARGMKKGASVIGGALQSAGKGIGKIFKKREEEDKKPSRLAGPLMMLAGIFIGLMKDTEEFKAIMAKIQGVVKDLMAKIMPVVQKLMKALMPVVDKLMEKLMPIIEYLADILIDDIMPIIIQLINAFLPLIDVMFQVLGPVLRLIGELVKALLPLFISLVNLLLPPLLQLLGNLMIVIGNLISSFGDFMLAMFNTFAKANTKEKELVEKIHGIGAFYTTTGKSLIAAAAEIKKANDPGNIDENEIANNTAKFEKDSISTLGEISGNTNPDTETVTKELYPAIIEAASSGFVQTENARTTVSGSPEAIAKHNARTLEIAEEQLELQKAELAVSQANHEANKETAGKSGNANQQATFDE